MKENKLLTGPVFSNLLKFAIPILFSLIIQALYGTVDLWMVSRFGTNADITGVSNGSQAICIVHGLFIGLSLGLSIAIGQSVGEHNDKKSAKTIGNGIIVMALIGIILSLVSASMAPLIVKWLDVPIEAYNKAIIYIVITGLGTICVCFYNILYNIFTGLGDSKTPLFFVLIACITNIFLDYILIAVYGLGTVGAAIATIAAQLVSVLLCLCVIKKKIPFKINKDDFKIDKKIALNILVLGLPIGLLRSLSELSYLVILGFVNELGIDAASGVGIAEKIILFNYLIPNAMMTAISAFVAQNIGAKNYKRANEGLKMGLLISGVIGIFIAYMGYFHGDLLSKLFIDDVNIIKHSASYLKATSIECLFLSLAFALDGYFDGTGHTTYVMIEGMIASLLVRIPVAYIATHFIKNTTVFNIGLANTFAALFTLLLGLTYLIIIKIKNKKTKIKNEKSALN